MRFPFLDDPKTGKPDELVTLTTLVTLAAIGRFMLDGVEIQIYSHSINFAHIDAMTYLAFLTPIVGAHGYIKGKGMIDGKDV